jgi:hypothetical protein
MVTHPDARRKDDLEQIARRAIQKYGFLPDFSADALRELEMLQQVDREAESHNNTVNSYSFTPNTPHHVRDPKGYGHI